jgi:ABC-type multidrug transport system permease subunit
LIVLGVVAATLAAAWPAVPVDGRAAVLVGAALSAANTVLAYFLTVWSIGRAPNVFLGVVLGGMVARMIAMLAAVVAAVLVLGLPALPLAASLLTYFVGFLAFELTALHRRTSQPAVAR